VTKKIEQETKGQTGSGQDMAMHLRTVIHLQARLHSQRAWQPQRHTHKRDNNEPGPRPWEREHEGRGRSLNYTKTRSMSALVRWGQVDERR